MASGLLQKVYVGDLRFSYLQFTILYGHKKSADTEASAPQFL